MTVVIPFHNGDAELLVDSCIPSLIKCGNRLRHSIIIFPTDGTDSLDLVQHSIYDLGMQPWVNVATDGVPSDKETGTFNRKVNVAFLHGAGLFSSLSFVTGPSGPMLWCEPDVTFVRENALDLLQAEQQGSGKDILGHLSCSRGVGLSMNGVAAYSAKAVSDMRRAIDTAGEPFDLQLSSYILPKMFTTVSLGQLPATRGLSKEESRFLVEAPGCPVLWHGVKDGSLWKHVKDGVHGAPRAEHLRARDKGGWPIQE